MDEGNDASVADLIDLEIRAIRDQSSGEPLDHSQENQTSVLESAEKTFFPHMWDPAQEKSKVQDIADYFSRDCGCESPTQFLNILNQMQVMRNRSGRPSGNLLEDTWRHVKELQFSKAQKGLAS